MQEITTDPNYLEGTINGRPIAGYHMVQYGETQEYLESLNKAGVILVYREDNPPEEGKLTLTKPNPDPVDTTVTQSPADKIYADPGLLRLCGPQPRFIINTNTDYPEPVPTKLIALVVFPELPLDEIPTDIAEYFAKFFPNQSLTETYSDEQIAQLQGALDSFIASRKVQEAKDTTDPCYNLEYNSAPADTTVTDSADKDNLPTGDVIDEDEKAFLNQILEKARAGISKNENNLPTGYIVIDPMPDSVKEKIIVAIEAYNKYPKMDPLDDDLPSGYVFTTEYTEEFEEKLKKAMESYFNAPIRRDPDDTRIAFISTVDAETEAVTSVQVASADDGGWRTVGTLNNPDGIDWKYQAGNLTGSGTASVVWHAQELGALGVWTDGTDNWTAVDGWFDANWTMLGCGDFDGDGKDSVLMSLYGGLFYSVDLDGTLASLGDLNWSGWEFGAVGDFAGDGRDDIVLLHRESGTVVMLADGNADSFERLGQLDASDWNIAGAGDFDGDGKADLLVRQTSTGIAGAYASADMSQWSPVTTDYLLA